MSMSDLSRAKQHEPDRSWPTEVKLQLIWVIGGHPHVRSMYISAADFFGLDGVGAPMDGSALVGHINNMRLQGPPPVERVVRRGQKRR